MVRLVAGRLEVLLAPDIGGSIARFDRLDGTDRSEILRGCEGYPEHVLQTGSFPLVPFANRIRGGRFEFRGRDVILEPNMAGDPSPLHGQGWLVPWEVTASTERSAHLRMEHQAGAWPWEYDATQAFALDEGGLTIDLTCRNLSPGPMPCGLGQHPFFPCGPETMLATGVRQVWTIDDDILPVDCVAAEGRFDLRDRRVCGQDLDHGFGGWDGSALFRDPTRPYEVEMSSPTAQFFQLYSPLAGTLVAAEPVTHANAALNAPEQQWAELGMAILECGEELSLQMRIRVGDC